jgi:hypothetical protein
MYSKLQNEIVKLRKQYSQIEVAKIFQVSQANISKIERTIYKKAEKSLLSLKESEKSGILFRRKFKSNPVQNALFILPYSTLEYEITGVTAQFLLTNYYELSNEVEIRTSNPQFSELWGGKILKGTPGPLYLIKEGIHIAQYEKILVDSLERDDLAGLKSAMVMVLSYPVDFSILTTLLSDTVRERYNQIIQALESSLKEYNLEMKWTLTTLNKAPTPNEEIIVLSRKIVDDFAPFLKDESK